MSEQGQDGSRRMQNDDVDDDYEIESGNAAEGANLRDDIGILSALLAASSRGDTHGTYQLNDGRIPISVGQLLSFLAGRGGSGGGTRDQMISLEDDEEDEDYIPEDDDDDDDYEDEEDNEDYMGWGHRNFNEVGHFFPTITEPQTAGLRLLYSGEFGPPPSGSVNNIEQEENRPQSKRATRRARRSLDPTPKIEVNQYPAHHTTYRLPLTPIRSPFAPLNYRIETARGLVPNSSGAIVALYDDKVYSGQFSLDANVYYSCTQGHDIWVYDANSTGNIVTHPQTGHKSRMEVLNRVKGIYGNWTVTDSHLSPDNERLIYSSISPVVHDKTPRAQCSTCVPRFQQLLSGTKRRLLGFYDDSFGIWTCRFSADGKEVVACGSQQIFCVPAHKQDVNSCCWADTASGNVLISGSDDTMIKVWDRRSLSSNRPSGVLQGIPKVSQACQPKAMAVTLYQTEKTTHSDLGPTNDARNEDVTYGRYGQIGYDYRYGNYRKPRRHAHPQDCSVMTYRGHSVFRTLIRCHFSPEETTGQAYIYSGSTDGKVYVHLVFGWTNRTDARPYQTLPITFDPREPDLPLRPTAQSSIGRHEWKSLGKRGLTLEDVVEKEQQEATEQWARTNILRHPDVLEPGFGAALLDVF
ncbi:WD40 repeat-like protein [Rhizoctonia solani]|uniref:WD40 repeat-like protein n=1 Tax=Rhizoctonia solani TaxID=456999 RepID=A0A8H7IE88_9AGAM|nr:WD40 repeat-like protein [Rhizoctonia solani]